MSSRDVLAQATGCDNWGEAVSWIAEGHDLNADVSHQGLLQALLDDELDHPDLEKAISVVVRQAAHSTLDTARSLFSVDAITPPSTYRSALDALAWKSPTRTLEGLTAQSVFSAQRENPYCIMTLCAVAGVTYRDLAGWVGDVELPNDPQASWTIVQVRAAFAAIDECLRGAGDPGLPGAAPSQPIELFIRPDWNPGGWTAVEMMRAVGVPYEAMLAQRVVGSPWGAHRNRTSSAVPQAIAAKIASELDERGISYRVAYPGSDYSVNTARLRELVGAEAFVYLVAIDADERPYFAVAVSTAKDGGTARATAGRLLTMEMPHVPTAVVLAGSGWSQRNETFRLAEKFGGHIYSDENVASLVEAICTTSPMKEDTGSLDDDDT